MAGNANSGKKLDKVWSEALRVELFQNDRKKLRDLAQLTVARAMAGDAALIKEIGDRLDGKAIQQIDSTAVVEHRYVKAPEKAKDDDWKQYLAHKTKPAQPVKSNGSNGSTH